MIENFMIFGGIGLIVMAGVFAFNKILMAYFMYHRDMNQIKFNLLWEYFLVLAGVALIVFSDAV